MKNILNARLAAALFVAPFIVFSFQIASCGGSTPDSSTLASGKTTTVKGTLSCTGKNCPTVTLNSTIDTSHGGGPMVVYLEGTTDSSIPAGTKIRVAVTIEGTVNR
ncbi:MAG TPA: hypothetical protein VNW04_13535 [Puia sp.]|jgi:hypothetical protein|nr:hypothetical protein [Puia sp.]